MNNNHTDYYLGLLPRISPSSIHIAECLCCLHVKFQQKKIFKLVPDFVRSFARWLLRRELLPSSIFHFFAYRLPVTVEVEGRELERWKGLSMICLASTFFELELEVEAIEFASS